MHNRCSLVQRLPAGFLAGLIAATVELLITLSRSSFPSGVVSAGLVVLGLVAADCTLGLVIALVHHLLAISWLEYGWTGAAYTQSLKLLEGLVAKEGDVKKASKIFGLGLAVIVALGGSCLLVFFFSTSFVNKRLSAVVCAVVIVAWWLLVLALTPLLWMVMKHLLSLLPGRGWIKSPLAATVLMMIFLLSGLGVISWSNREIVRAIPKAWVVSVLALAVPYFIFGRISFRPRAAIISLSAWAVLLIGAALLVPMRQAGLNSLYNGAPAAGRLFSLLEPVLRKSKAQVSMALVRPGPSPIVHSRSVNLPGSIKRDLSLILITIDALRADHLGLYGYKRKTSPNLDKIGGQSIVFERFYTNAPTTRWAVPVIMTSRYPAEISWDFSSYPNPVRPGNLCLAEVLKSAGFETGAILGFYIFKRSWGIDQGFDHYDNSTSRIQPTAETRAYSSNVLTDKAIKYLSDIEDAKGGNPRFFLWVHYLDPHRVYVDHKDAPAFGERPVDLYDKEIWFTDKHIGRLIDWLKQKGLYSNTIIAITADHGEAFSEHGFTDHGYTLHNEETRVPMIIHVPGLKHKRVQAVASHIDLAPTLLNLLGVAIPSERFEGRNLVPVILDDPEKTNGRAFLEIYYGRSMPQRTWAVLDDKYKLIYDETRNTWSLFDEIKDYMERNNLVESLPKIAARYAALLKGYMAACRHPDWEAARKRNRISRVPGEATLMDVTFGRKFKLVGAKVRPEKIRPGERAVLDLYFSDIEETKKSYRVFVHVEGRDETGKRCRFLADHLPAKGLLPTYRWKKGDIIKDECILNTSAKHAGCKFKIFIGFYGPERNGPRLKAAGSGVDHYNRAMAGSLEVLP
ncbi:MAG: sulfatase-like hydrolase/transferase [Deltaproteobacteria bacterium]|nr:sulfatase-like hydrolase/transferase [Deltaproteobacteria bacterium]